MPLTNSLKTDLYEMTMAAGYFQGGHNPGAVFELYCHTLPENRSYLIACGLQQAVEHALGLRFSDDDIRALRALPVFAKVRSSFFRYLKNFRFSGDLWALPEGEICFANEPILQVRAPIIEAQILETYLLSVVNIGTLVATKASRVVAAASHDGHVRPVVDFGSRRAHGPEAGILAARAAYIGGCLGTSNVYAARVFGIPVFGTMAHSWVQSFPDEITAFERFRSVFPEDAILLVDTFDTIGGVEAAVRLGRPIRGVRLDSGNIARLSRRTRRLLDRRGMKGAKILASGNLNEYKIHALVASKAPVDIFGVGTEMVVSRDDPALDLTYKLVQTEEKNGKVRHLYKSSEGKNTVPGRKQVFRYFGRRRAMRRDAIGLFTEPPPKSSRPLLKPFILNGKLVKPLPATERIRRHADDGLFRLPSGFRSMKKNKDYPVAYTRRILDLKTQRQAIGAPCDD